MIFLCFKSSIDPHQIEKRPRKSLELIIKLLVNWPLITHLAAVGAAFFLSARLPLFSACLSRLLFFSFFFVCLSVGERARRHCPAVKAQLGE